VLAAGCVSFPAIVGASPRARELPEPVACEGCCRPALESSWQWPLQGPIDTSFDVEMYDVDGFEVPRG